MQHNVTLPRVLDIKTFVTARDVEVCETFAQVSFKPHLVTDTLGVVGGDIGSYSQAIQRFR